MTDINKIIGVVASALYLDANELTAALKDGDEWLAEKEFSDTLSGRISEQVKAAKEDQLKRGTRESWSSVERWMKSQGFTPEKGLKGQDLLDAFAEFVEAKAPAGNPDTLTKEALAKNPLVKELQNEARANIGKELEAVKGEFETYKATTERARVSEVAKAKLAAYLEEGKVLLEVAGAGVNKAQRIEAIAKFLDFNQIGLSDKGEPIFMDGDSPALDEMGKPIDFKKKVVSIGAELFGIQNQDPNKGGGNPKPGSASGGGTDYKVEYNFATAAELDATKFSESDPAKRAKMTQDFMYTQKQKEAAGN